MIIIIFDILRKKTYLKLIARSKKYIKYSLL